MKKICLCCLALLCLTNLFAQETVNYKEKKPYKTWVKMAPKLNDEFFKTPEASALATMSCSINKLPAAGLKTSICLPN